MFQVYFHVQLNYRNICKAKFILKLAMHSSSWLMNLVTKSRMLKLEPSLFHTRGPYVCKIDSVEKNWDQTLYSRFSIWGGGGIHYSLPYLLVTPNLPGNLSYIFVLSIVCLGTEIALVIPTIMIPKSLNSQVTYFSEFCLLA